MANSATNNTTVITIDAAQLLNVNMSNVTKLTASNFLMWSRQVQALLNGHGLSGYLDGTVVVPPPTIMTAEVVSVNPAFTAHQRQDQLIYSALLGAISVTVQPILATTTTSAEIWEKLSSTYAKPTRGHIQQLRQQIKQWKKGTKSIDEYLQGFTTRFDQLALLGKAFDLEDQIEFIVEGLPEDYKQVIDQIQGRDVPPSLTEVHEKLLNQEVKLQDATPNPSLPISANVANTRVSNNTNNRSHNSGYRGNNNRYNNGRNNHNTWQQQDTNLRGYQGKCQICGVFGHSARRCPQLQQSGGYNNSSQTPWQPRANMAATAYNPNNWIVDSGATHHLTTDLHNLSLHQPYNGGEEVIIADGSGLPITHTGSSTLSTSSRPLALNNILYVPNLHKNLISVYRLCNANRVSVEFFPAHFQVKDLSTGVRLLQGRARDELYEWPVESKPTTTSLFASPTPKTTLISWHSRLGHPTLPTLKTLVSQFSLPVSLSSQKQIPCSHCLINKSHKLPFHSNTIVSTQPLEYVYTDVWSSPIVSIDNFKYYLIFVDHFTRYTWLYPLKFKSQVRETFVAFKAVVENRFQSKIRTLYSDNGGEFIALKAFLLDHGISHLTSPPHTPEHNGIAERKHRHIVETGLTLLHQASLPPSYWSYAFSAAVYLINRLPSSVLSNTSPYAVLFQQSPNYLKLRVFGCACYPWLRPYASNKLELRSKECVFLGYSLTQSAYLCLDHTTGRVYTSRHVQFIEEKFPFSAKPPSTPVTDEPDTSNSYPFTTSVPLHQTPPPVPLVSATSTAMPPPSSDSHHRLNTDPPSSSSSQMNDAVLSSDDTRVDPGIDSTELQSNAQVCTQTLPPPIVHATGTLNQTDNPDTNLTSNTSQSPNPTSNPLPQNTHSMRTRSKNQITKPNPKHSLLTVKTNLTPIIPTTVTQALRDEKWRNSMVSEMDAQIRNRTFDLVPPRPHQHVIPTKWIHTVKYNPDGTLARHKSRWVARAFNQQHGIDYAETFSPVVKSITIRLVLQLAISRNWPIKQLDVNNAFLQGTLQDEVYVTQPPGFLDKDRPHHVCRLRKALYGLKQAPRAWYQELKTYLISIGFKNSMADTSAFVYNKDGHQVYCLVYVDDIIITGSSSVLVAGLIASLSTRFSLKEPEDLRYFLGIEVTRTSQGLHLMQRKYITDLLQRTKMSDAKIVSTPMATTPKLSLTSGRALTEPAEYRTVIGSLQYLAFTRPDIAYAVNRLSQFMHRPTDIHWQAAKRILRYLAGTTSHGILLRKDSPLSLHAYSDADWAGDVDDFVSTNAHILYLGTSPIAWSSKKQKGVARSSTEAEYRAVANTAAELRWVCSLLTELGVTLPHTPVVYCDNVGATYLCANPVFHSRMKHLALDYHFIRDNVSSGALRVSHVSTHDQLADALTKPLSRTRFHELSGKIGVRQLPPS